MITIHFVYSMPPPIDPVPVPGIRRLVRILRSRLQRQPSYRSGVIRTSMYPLRAPYSITVNLARFLGEHAVVRCYDWAERGVLDLQDGDILLGHPHPDPETLVQRTIREASPAARKILILPIHHALTEGPESNTFILPLLDAVDKVIAITGSYWYDTLGESIFAKWKDKFVRLDLAVDVRDYPRVKTRFNPPGQRGFVYIGSNREIKGTPVLSATFGHLTGYRRGWVGPGDAIPQVPRIAEYRDLTPSFISTLAEMYDVFVNTSISDPNPTTILESMAWGFPVACTPQSGYYNMPSIIPLSTTDIEFNIRQLQHLQNATPDELQQLANTNRRLVEENYTWDRFVATVWNVLNPVRGSR